MAAGLAKGSSDRQAGAPSSSMNAVPGAGINSDQGESNQVLTETGAGRSPLYKHLMERVRALEVSLWDTRRSPTGSSASGGSPWASSSSSASGSPRSPRSPRMAYTTLENRATVPSTFQMPLHYPRYSKADYQAMPEEKLDRLLEEYGLPVLGSLSEKRNYAMGVFLWKNQRE